jgi:16S rRNA (cytosine967-C5)-methyltransferase
VNAVLNRAPKSIDDVALPDPSTALREYVSLRYSLPRWIVDRWTEEYGPDRAGEICAASSEEAPRTIRVNTLKTTTEALQRRLSNARILTATHPTIPDLLQILEGGSPTETKAFREGLFYVQDGASLLPAHLAGPQPGERIADVCAAPGGKSTHLAALTGGKSLVAAMDRDLRRMWRLRDNVARLGTARVAALVADGDRAPFAPESFDVVLLDAPCTGLGTLRRRPDLKWRLQPEAPARLAAVQRRLLRSAIGLCKNGGCVVYSVCTFTPEETFGVLESIKGDGAVSFEDGPPWMDSWKINPGQYRVLPAAGGLDGYFLARLRKRS